MPLTFVRIEPYIQPKTSLSANGAERVDTRVLEVVFRFSNNDGAIYVGQQLDVFIETGEEPGMADAEARRES